MNLPVEENAKLPEICGFHHLWCNNLHYLDANAPTKGRHRNIGGIRMVGADLMNDPPRSVTIKSNLSKTAATEDEESQRERQIKRNENISN
jgi:hypothetical protein